MIHNHVPELIDIFKRYEAAIWSFLKKAPTDRDLGKQIRYTGDRPTTSYLEDLQNYNSGLKAILSVSDYGTLTRRNAYFGTYDVAASTRIGVTLTTADPSLREKIGSGFMIFLQKNPGLVVGKETNWALENISSGGFIAAPQGLFGRIYYLWLQEIS